MGFGTERSRAGTLCPISGGALEPAMDPDVRRDRQGPGQESSGVGG